MNQYNFNFLNNDTYQVFFRIIDSINFEVSMTNMEESYLGNDMNFLIQKKVLTKPKLEILQNKLSDFYNKYDRYIILD